MITDETLEFAYTWFNTGVQRIENQSINLGITYLDKAMAVFAEVGDTRMVTYTRHYKLLGLKLDERFEEAQSLYADTQAGYVQLEEDWGRTLLLTHLGECIRGQGHFVRAFGYLNLASFMAESATLEDLLDYIYYQKALACQQREDLYHAVRFLQSAEKLADQRNRHDDLNRYLHLRAEIMIRMGENSEATMLLEDVKNRLIKQGRYREAVDPLNKLRRLYQYGELQDDEARITELLHFCGQQMLKVEDDVRGDLYLGPPIAQRAA